MINPIKRQHVSEIDDCLMQFDQSNPEKSVSQQKEIAKHARIAQLRDGVSLVKPSENKDNWKDF